MQKTLVKLIARFVGHKCITFDGSRVYYWKVPMIIMPMRVLSFLQHNLEQKHGPDTRKIMYALGKIQGRNGSNILIEKFKVVPNEKDLSFFMEQTEFVGVGKITLDKNEVSKGYMLINNENSTNAKAYTGLFGKRKAPICDYVRGLTSGAVEAIYQAASGNHDEVEGVEIKCQAKGDKFCKIEVKKDWTGYEDELPGELKGIDSARKKQTLSMLLRPAARSVEKPETELSIAIKRHYGDNHIKYEKGGEVVLFGMDCLITPIDMANWLYFVLRENYGPSIDDEFYKAGQMLGQESTKGLFAEFKLQKNLKNIKMAFEQPGLYGLGHVTPMKVDTSNGRYFLRVSNTPGVHHKELLGLTKEKIDYFLAGMFSGIINEITGKDVTIKEETCSASGASHCIFKA